jgi:uncharacterized protein YndB with AHSA1/START domain
MGTLEMNPKSNDANNNNNNQNGTVTMEGGYAILRYERRLAYPPEAVWKAITDPKELAAWFNTKAVIDGRNGGTIDFVNTLSTFHTTGRILVWDPPHVFEHEWHIAPNPQVPKGEPDAVICWELVRDENSNTILIVLTAALQNTQRFVLHQAHTHTLIVLRPTSIIRCCRTGWSATPPSRGPILLCRTDSAFMTSKRKSDTHISTR